MSEAEQRASSEDRVATLAEELQRKDRALEALRYAVSHDLRAPLRAIDGFSQAIIEDCPGQLDERGRGHLSRVRAAAKRMDQLIEGMLSLSLVSQRPLRASTVDLSAVAAEVIDELRARQPTRLVVARVSPRLVTDADPQLARTLLEQLLDNAWKFTAPSDGARVEVGGDGSTFFVRDNGVGFDMAYASRLFVPFQRLHGEAQFAGLGIGLATVQRIVDRHGGRVWAEGAVDGGATVYFTFASRPRQGAS